MTLSTIETFAKGQRIKLRKMERGRERERERERERVDAKWAIQSEERERKNWFIEYFACHIVALVSHGNKRTRGVRINFGKYRGLDWSFCPEASCARVPWH